jgi:predicted sulfurtransferase
MIAVPLLASNREKSGLRKMKCPHLADWILKSCEACEQPYAPSLFQLSEYCRKHSHKKCPFYMDNRDKLDQTMSR